MKNMIGSATTMARPNSGMPPCASRVRGSDLEEGPGRRHRDDGPADREQERDQVGGARGTLLQRLQDLADRLAVVIGGPPLRGVFDPGSGSWLSRSWLSR